MPLGARLGGPACAALLLASLAGGAASAWAQAPAAVTANGAASAAVRPELEAFDAAWNILRKNYVAESASHVDWDALRAELRPRAEAARSADDVRAVIREMLARIGQSHFAILPAPVASDLSGPALQSSEVGSLGFDVGPVEGHLAVTRVEIVSFAARVRRK
jgi:carboxyl-terminal processing protease